ncbi:MAG TPA: IclR family transcriptional regulator [Candidatus Sulfotelmatobacter sp.]|jgi:IclR family acetate operon transcriptional repressor|nr:IclR family transcriptional regulator [Candidatus Sulfotelmatobacter sp.]
MTSPLKRNYNITALQRGLRILHLFSESQRGLTAKQVAGLSKLPVSTVHRFLANLVAAGFLNRDSEGTHCLGIACFSIGQAAAGQLDIRRLSLPYLRELNQQTRETIHLTVRHGLSAVYVEKLDSPEPLRIYSRIGASVPLYCTAVGKVLLAYMPPDEQERVLPQLDLKRLTTNSVGNLQQLRTELYRVRKNGYASDLEEHELHIRCVAAPIWDHTGNVQSSLSITAPAFRMPVTRLRQLAPLIQAAGLKISTEFGYQPSLSRFRSIPENGVGRRETPLAKVAV